jgi:hypothetical protein
MPKGNTKTKSLIHKHNLEDVVKELHLRGTNYTEISKIINERSGIHLSRMAISRFINSTTPDELKSNVITNMSSIRQRTAENNITLLSDFDLAFNDIISLIETSHLNPVEKGILKKNVINKMKPIRNNIVQSRGELLDIFNALNSTINASNQFLVDTSTEFCPICSKKVVRAIKDLEESDSFRM